MRRFLYFFPGLSGMNASMLSARGLVGRFAGAGSSLLGYGVTGTTAPQSGCIVTVGGQPPQLPIPDKALWIQGRDFWVACEDPQLPPGPEDVARELGISGYEVPLGDGNLWRVPLLHRWDSNRQGHVPNLPRAMVPIPDNGHSRVEFRVRAEYAVVDAIAHKAFAGFVAQKTMPLDELLTDAAAVLAVNYRIGIEEIGLLGLLDDATALRVLGLCIDLPALEAEARELATQGVEFHEPVVREE